MLAVGSQPLQIPVANTEEIAVPMWANTKPATFSHLSGDQTELLQTHKVTIHPSACEPLEQGP